MDEDRAVACHHPNSNGPRKLGPSFALVATHHHLRHIESYLNIIPDVTAESDTTR